MFHSEEIDIERKWGGRPGSNRRQPESQSGALPTELRPPQIGRSFIARVRANSQYN